MIANIYVQFIYQPFFNILVLIYKGLSHLTDNPDMGVALIIFTIILRIILYPMAKRNERTEGEKLEILNKINEIKKTYGGRPIEEKNAIRMLIKKNRKAAFFEMLNLTIQVGIALMLFRIFRTGLSGADFHLLYGWIPEIKEPFNLVFLRKFDLTHPNMVLNTITSAVIFIAEAENLYLSPFPVTKGERLMFQLALPIVAFIFFGLMPAGKKLFVITTLSISIIIMTYKIFKQDFGKLFGKKKKRLYIYQ